MSLNYTSRIIIGFIIEPEKVYKTVKKFDPDTGEPVELKIFSHDRYLLQDKIIIDDPGEDLYTGDKYEGMEIIESGYEKGIQILGTVLAKADDYSMVSEVTNIETQASATFRFGTKHNLTPILYVVLSC